VGEHLPALESDLLHEEGHRGRIVHAFNKLNDMTIPAQTPIPRKDTILGSMPGSEIYSAIDLTDGFTRFSCVRATCLSQR
jgi:hypothetical protein